MDSSIHSTCYVQSEDKHSEKHSPHRVHHMSPNATENVVQLEIDGTDDDELVRQTNVN